jgi:HlyD family secretion protein
MAKWFKISLVTAALVTLAGAAALQFRGREAAAPEFQIVAVSRGSLVQAIAATGQLAPLINVEVGSQISGRIHRIHVDFNSEVKEGQLLAEIDPVTFEANVNQARGELVSAKAGLTLARANAERAKALHERQLVSSADLDQARGALEQAEAAVLIRQHSLERSEAELARCNIYAPIDGIVISRSIDVGQTVAASLNSPVLFTIANDLRQMQIGARVSEADIGGVRDGQEVNFSVDAFPGRQFTGTVTQVRNSAQTVENVVTYETIIAVENRDLRLKPGMTANVSIVAARRDDSLRLPNAALRARLPDHLRPEPPPEASDPSQPQLAAAAPAGGRGAGGGGQGWRRGGGGGEGPTRVIYRVGANGQPEALRIRAGISDGQFTEVVDGLAEGDRIIVGLALQATSSSAPAANNPFGGGSPFRR